MSIERQLSDLLDRLGDSVRQEIQGFTALLKKTADLLDDARAERDELKEEVKTLTAKLKDAGLAVLEAQGDLEIARDDAKAEIVEMRNRLRDLVAAVVDGPVDYPTAVLYRMDLLEKARRVGERL